MESATAVTMNSLETAFTNSSSELRRFANDLRIGGVRLKRNRCDLAKIALAMSDEEVCVAYLLVLDGIRARLSKRHKLLCHADVIREWFSTTFIGSKRHGYFVKHLRINLNMCPQFWLTSLRS